MNLLARLRNRRRLVARLTAPLLCVVWLGAFGCPCVMAADMVHAATAPHQTHHESHCPNCPGEGHGSSVGCSSVHNVVNPVPPALPLKWDLSHVSAVAEPSLGDTPARFVGRVPRTLHPGAHAPPVPLRLRYCTFLN